MAGPWGKLTWNGSLPSGEIFSYHFCVHRTDGADVTVAQLAAAGDLFQGSFLTGASGAQTLWTAGTTWSPVKAELIDPATGKVYLQAYGSSAKAGSQPAGNGSLPPGVAVAVTLRGTTGAKAIRGRFFLPAPQNTLVTSAGRMPSANQVTLAGALANAFTALSGGAVPMTAAIYSTKHRAFYLALRGDVGDVYDSMRTRRDKLVEARKSIFG